MKALLRTIIKYSEQRLDRQFKRNRQKNNSTKAISKSLNEVTKRMTCLISQQFAPMHIPCKLSNKDAQFR